jgi:uncharacterized membrane protein YjfL (UPF0719 family)
MNLYLLLQGIIEIAISILSGVFIFIMSFKVFSLLTREVDEVKEIKENNIAISILGTSFIFGIMLMIRSAIGPAMDTLTVIMGAKQIVLAAVITAIIRILVIYILTALFAFIILWFSLKLFMMITTNIDEMKEMKNNNVSISLVIATLIISMSLLLSAPLTTLLSSIIPSAEPANANVVVKNSLINLPVFLNGLTALGLSLFGTVFVFFISFKILDILTKDISEIEEIKKNNIAVGILASAFILGVMIIINATISPALKVLGFAFTSPDSGVKEILFSLLRILLFFLLSTVISYLTIWLAMNGFMFLTKTIDELAEIKKNNIAVAIMFAVLIISAAILLDHGVQVLLSGLIKTPEFGKGLMDLSNIQ